MANQFLKLRRSAVPGRIPSTSSLDFGEIALNTYDGLAFIKKSGSAGEQVIAIGSTSGSFTGSFLGSFTGLFTGSLFGTASWANNATTSSYILNAVSASYASGSTSASYATSASQAQNAVTASYLSGYISPFPYTGSAQITGSLGVTGSVSISGSTGTLLSANVDSIIFTGSFAQSGSVTVSGSVSVIIGTNDLFLIKSGSVPYFNISGSGNTTINSNLFIIKNFTTQQPVLTVSQSIVQFATQSSEPTGSIENGSIWFTSTNFYVGLD